MVTRRFLTVLFLGFICLLSEAQTIYSYNGKCRIEFPDKLELQSSELNSFRNIAAQNKKPQINVLTQSGHITFQQKGLNADVKSAYNKYCRVIIEYFVYLQRVLVRDIYLLLNFLSRITTSEKETSKNPKTQRSRTIAQTSP